MKVYSKVLVFPEGLYSSTMCIRMTSKGLLCRKEVTVDRTAPKSVLR